MTDFDDDEDPERKYIPSAVTVVYCGLGLLVLLFGLALWQAFA